MKSITVLLVAALALIAGGAAVHAKPKIAVLGLEVIDNGNVDKETTLAAQRLTNELRARASRPAAKYSLAPNSAKDLLELKLLSDCSDEGRTCMADIGTDLGADRLLYGKLERRKKGYQVSLKLLNTNTRQMERTTSELIPTDDLHTAKINKWARSLFNRLIGVPELGTLTIDANIARATIYVDGEVATTLRDGSAKVLGLSEGTHTLSIEADGYQRYEAEVAISAGATEELSVSLRREQVPTEEPPGGEGDDGGIWKVGFVGGVLVTGGMAAGWTYYGLQAWGDLDQAKVDAWSALKDGNLEAYSTISEGASGGVVQDSCGKAARYEGESDATLRAFIQACEDGEEAASRATLFIAGTAVAALATAYMGYQGWVVHGDSNKEKRRAARKKKKGHRVIVTPQLSGDSIGAGLSLEF